MRGATGITLIVVVAALASGPVPSAAQECGNGVVEGAETCDPPGAPAGLFGNTCRTDCTVCGDHLVQSPTESCDFSVGNGTCRTLACDPGSCQLFFVDPCARGCSSWIDAFDLAETRAEISSSCDCAAAASRREYLRCVRDVVRERVAWGGLFRACKGAALYCAKNSTCGSAEAVTCCRMDASGSFSGCSIKRDASRCTAPSNGTACVGSHASCCDACTGSGCAP